MLMILAPPGVSNPGRSSAPRPALERSLEKLSAVATPGVDTVDAETRGLLERYRDRGACRGPPEAG